MESRDSEKTEGSADRDHEAIAKKKKPTAEDMVLDMDMPEWAKILLAISGITSFQLRLTQERERRTLETYQNHFQEVYNVVSSMKFEIASATLIMINCLLVGFEMIAENKRGYQIVENLFIFIFFVEWCFRLCAFGWVWLFEFYSAMDTFLVFGTGVIPMWIMKPMGTDTESLRILTVLRALRLGRVVRIVRMIPQFKELWFLMQGLGQSFRPLAWTFCIAITILYIFGIAATELIGKQDAMLEDEYIQELFGDPLKSMFTLFQLLTLDTWAYTIARPVMEKDWNMCLFFITFITVSVFVFWNLITAVIVGSAMDMAAQDTTAQAKALEAQKKQQLKALADIFLEIDTDGSGELTAKEFDAAMDIPKVQQLLTILGYKMSEMKDLWDILDDGDGSLTIKEFTNGLRRMRGEARARDISDIIKRLRHSALHHADLSAQAGLFSKTIGALEGDVERIQSDTGEILSLFQEMYHRLQAHIDSGEAEDRFLAKRRAKMRDMEEDFYEAIPIESNSPPPSPTSD